MTFLDESVDDDDDDEDDDNDDDEDDDGVMVNYFQTWILNSANLLCSTRAFLQSVTLKRKFANSGWKKFKFAQICHSL